MCFYETANLLVTRVTNAKDVLNVAPCMLPHLLYNPTHALFTL